MRSWHVISNGGAEYGVDRMSNGGLLPFQPTTQHNMFTSYAESVRAHADAAGKLPADVIEQVFSEHCCLSPEDPRSSFAHYSSSSSDENWDDADRILSWLGY